MRYNLKRYWIVISLLILLIVVMAIFASKEIIRIEIFVGLLVASITTYIATMTHYHNSDKLFKELFTEFNARYDKMNDFLNNIQAEQKLDKAQRQKVIDYLNLCSEEYMWVKKGRIPEHIWNSWKNGIYQYLKNPVINEIFETEKALWKSSYYGFFDEVK